MVTEIKASTPEVIYPDRDGLPMSDNTLQYRWMTVIKHNLDWLFSKDENVFVAGDLLWYPVEGDNKTRQAPDVMVVFGRPKGDRGSYMQWREDNIPPQVAFEILSPGNRQTEMNKKLLFYERYGIEEYYIYDPDKNDLGGWLRRDNRLEVIDNIEDWVSPRLGIRFLLTEPELLLYYPNGEPFTSYVEVRQRLEESQSQLAQERRRAEEAEAELERLKEKMRSLGIDGDSP